MANPTETREHRVKRYSEELSRWAFLAPALLFLLLFFGYPIVKNVTMSLQDYTTRTFYTGQAPFVGADNYLAVIGSSVFTRAVLNTVLFTVGSIGGQFTIGLALAVFFTRRFPLNGVLRSLLLLPWLLPRSSPARSGNGCWSRTPASSTRCWRWSAWGRSPG